MISTFTWEPSEDARESLYDTIVFSSRDYSIDPEDAWIYGIIVGWDGPSLKELAKKFNWPTKTCKRLEKLHRNFKALVPKRGKKL